MGAGIVLDENPRKASKTFLACCVLHNICVDMGDRLDDQPNIIGIPAPPPLLINHRRNDEGKRVRDTIRDFL